MHSIKTELGSSPTSGTRVILVRHGQSTYNQQGRYQGRCDESVLTQKGRECAYQTGVALQELAIEAIYTSPLKRAQQTTTEIVAALRTKRELLPSLQVSDKLQEIDLPNWQGLLFQDVREQFAEDYRCWKERPHQFQLPTSCNVETLETTSLQGSAGNLAVATSITQRFPVLEVYEQAEQFWQELLPRHVGQTVLIVSHGGTIRALISTAIGLTPERYHVLQQSNCGISLLNFPNRLSNVLPVTARLERLNLTQHLGETLPKLKEGKQGLRLLLVPSDSVDLRQMNHLAESLKSVSIDLTLSSDLDSYKTAEHILQHHPSAIHQQVLRENFLDILQQMSSQCSQIASNTKIKSARLITGLVVVNKAIIKCILGQILGVNSSDFSYLLLQEGTISVVHYPLADHPPVLQTMNSSGRHCFSS